MSKSNKRNQKKNQKSKGAPFGFQVPNTPTGASSPATNLFLQTPPFSPDSPPNKGGFFPPTQAAPSFASPTPFDLNKSPPPIDEPTKASALPFQTTTPFPSLFGGTTPSAGFSFSALSSQTPFQATSSPFLSNLNPTFGAPSSTPQTNPTFPTLFGAPTATPKADPPFPTLFGAPSSALPKTDPATPPTGPSDPPKFSPSQIPTTSSSFSFSNSPDVSVFSSFMSTLPKPNEQPFASLNSGMNFSFSSITSPTELPQKTQVIALESPKTSSNIAASSPQPVQPSLGFSTKPPTPPKVTPTPPKVTPTPPKVIEKASVTPTPPKVPEQTFVIPSPPKVTPSPPKVTPTPPKVTPTPLKVTPTPPKLTPSPPKVTPTPLKVTPTPPKVPEQTSVIPTPPKVIEETFVKPMKVLEQASVTPPKVLEKASVTPPKVLEQTFVKPMKVIEQTSVSSSRVERTVKTSQVERSVVSPPKVQQPSVTPPKVERSVVSSPKVQQSSEKISMVDITATTSKSVKERVYFVVDADVTDNNKQKRKPTFDNLEKSKKFRSDFVVYTEKLDLSPHLIPEFSSNVISFLKKIGLNLTSQSIRSNDIPTITRYEKEIDEIGTTVNMWKQLLSIIPDLISKSPERSRQLCYLTMTLIDNDVTALKQILNFKEATTERQFQWIKEFGTHTISYLSEPTGANHIDSLKISGVDVPAITIPNTKTSFTTGDCFSNLEKELENNGISKKLIQTEIMDVLQKQKIVGDHPLVTKDDLLALRFFTRGDPEIRTANALLRDLTSSDNRKRTQALEKSKNYTNLIYHTQRAILNLPGPERSILVYRGDSVLPAGINEWKAGTEIVWNSFTTCVESASFAMNFTEGQVLYVIQLEATQGCSLRHYSPFPSEKEYLLPAFCKFKVLNISQEKNVSYQVHLKCLYIDEMCYLQK